MPLNYTIKETAMEKSEFKAAFKEECGRPWFKKMLAQQTDAVVKATRETAINKQPKKETATLPGTDK